MVPNETRELQRLHSRRPATAMITCSQRNKKTTDKTGSRVSPSSKGRCGMLNERKTTSNNQQSARLSCDMCEVHKASHSRPCSSSVSLPLRRQAGRNSLGASCTSFVSTKSPFVLSTSSPRTPCRWTCDKAWDRKEHSTTSRSGKSTFCLGGAMMEQHNASGVRPAIGCLFTSLLPVLSCPPWEGNVVRCVLTSDTKASRAAPDHGAKTNGAKTMVSGTRMTNFCVVNQPHVAERQPEAVPGDEGSGCPLTHPFGTPLNHCRLIPRPQAKKSVVCSH